jgi:tRNA-specific 2-thiouridylase
VALHAPGRLRAGPVVSTAGEELGRHGGVHRFTVGQRRGLGVPGPVPRYVVRLEPEAGRVVVGTAAEASRSRFMVREVRWVSGAPPAAPVEARVKVRHRHEGEGARVAPRGADAVEVELGNPVRGVAPGQAAVFYDGDEVLGGGRIV